MALAAIYVRNRTAFEVGVSVEVEGSGLGSGSGSARNSPTVTLLVDLASAALSNLTVREGSNYSSISAFNCRTSSSLSILESNFLKEEISFDPF
jgi:hypothetical protein